MRKKALQSVLDAVEARKKALLGGGKNFGGGFSTWVSLKSRPTQFNSSKNFPAGPREFWKEKEPIESAPIA